MRMGLASLTKIRLLAKLETVQQEEDWNRDNRVHDRADKLMDQLEMDAWVGQQSPADEVQHAALHQAEPEVQQDAVGHVVHIHCKSNAGSDVADDALGDTVDTEGMVGEAILQQADDSTGDGAGDGVASRYGEEDRRNQRKVNVVEPGPRLRQHRLQQDAEQRRQHGDDGSKRVLIEFGSGCVTVFRHAGCWTLESGSRILWF